MKLVNKTKYTYTFGYWQAFMIPFVVMLAGCIGNGIYPFGNSSFLRNDLYHQYMPFFQALYDKIWQGEGLSYSFELGAGAGFAALYGYYLASPVNWLVLLCPRSLIIEFITLLILVKVGFSGVSFAYYLEKHFGKKNMGMLFFGSAYALSGFMAAYQWNIMWLDVVALAPLVIWALEELIEKGKGTMYCLLLALSIFTNFYLSIMLCIFLVLYFVAVVIWKPWKVKWRSCLLFGWYSLLAGGMSAVMLLPVYFALSGTEFNEFNFPETVKWYMNLLEELARHCMSVSMKMQADHWPNIYSGVAVFLLLPMFVLNRKISWKQKISKIFLAAVFLLSFSCNILDFIWHGLNYPDSLPGRQSYLYCWLILVMAYEVYLNLRKVRLVDIVVSALLGYGAVIAAWLFTDVEGTDVWTYVLTLIFMSIYLCLLLGHYAWRFPQVRAYVRGQKWKVLFTNRYLGVQVLVLLIVIVELASNTYLTSIHTVNRTGYVKHYKNAEVAIDWMKEQDTGLYRTEIFNRQTKNDSMMWDIKTATVFSSTVHAGIVDFYESMGMGTTRVSYWHQGATPLVSALLGVRYMVGEDDSMNNDLYELIYEDETGFLYRNKFTLPMGYVLDSELEEQWDLSKYNPVNVQNKFCQLLGVSGDLLVPIAVEKIDASHYKVLAEEDAYVFVYLSKNSLSEVKATVGDKSKKFSQVSFDYLLDLGYVAKNTDVNLEVVEEDEKFNTFKAYMLNLRVLEETIAALSETTLQITEHGENYFKGSLEMKEPGTLVVPIPMEKGWTLYVNGQETAMDTFKDAFMAINLGTGSYEIELEFSTPGFKEGLQISLACAAVFVLCWYIERKRNSKIVL